MKTINIKTNIPYSIFINNRGEIDTNKYRKIHLISDENVRKLYFLKSDYEYIIKPGEKSKSFETYKNLCEEIIKNNIHRNDLIITFGGGVVGDLGGFVASTILRGIDFIQIPTTLLAMVDSSVGGKVAINTDFGKNLVGAFYQPKAVYINTNYLDSLPKRVYNDGMGEIIKYNLIYDKDIFKNENIEDIIYKCCKIKGEIVSLDEKDNNIRKILNYGHTLGHAIEKYYNYNKFTHGEAISIGMYHMALVSEKLGAKNISQYTKNLLEKYDLPYNLPQIDNLIDFISKDKKSTGDTIDCILLETIGKAYIKKLFPKDLVDLL